MTLSEIKTIAEDRLDTTEWESLLRQARTCSLPGRYEPEGWKASNDDGSYRWIGENDPSRTPPGDDWHWVDSEIGGQWYQGEHADIDTLAVPEERRPHTGAPLRRLLGYLIRQWLRRWTARLEKRGR